MTCGPTWVPLDSVRVLSNISSGEFGHTLCQLLDNAGARVTLLEGPVTHRANFRSTHVVRFNFFDELAKLLERELRKYHYDAVIHAAAVSDYRPQTIYDIKIRSNFSNIKLNLVPTEKLIDKIKAFNPKVFLVGFKLETHLDKQLLLSKAHDLLARSHCDLIVANSIFQNAYRAYIVDPEKNILASAKSRKVLAGHLMKVLEERL